jgi:hypothetical protein
MNLNIEIMDKLNKITLEKIIDDLYGLNEDTGRDYDTKLTQAIKVLEDVQEEMESLICEMDSEDIADYIGDMRMEIEKENAD